MTEHPNAPELPLLPNEPRVLDAPQQQQLTDTYLTPALADIEALMRGIRARLDPLLKSAQPSKWGKPYPLGQCLEISRAVKQDLARLNPASLNGAAAKGHAALATFLNHGGQMHQVWGDLRGDYFQNAFLAGTLYIDVANDTVVPTKPPVEILPFATSGLHPIQDFQHYARIAQRYWHAQLHPNHLLPDLAPYYPIIAVIPGGGIRLEADSGYMVLLAQRQRFQSSAAILRQPTMERGLFARLHSALMDQNLILAEHPEQGRALALAACQAKAQTWPTLTDSDRAQLGATIARVNRCWAT
ncbi:MAG: hypothetical protein H7842_10285 [Gammaproteobacteria bacterium SHHR-1]